MGEFWRSSGHASIDFRHAGGDPQAAFTDRFSGIRDAVLTLRCRSVVIDGEVVVCNEDGTPNFRRLHFRSYADQTLCVWAFDVMELNGADLRPLPLTARKQKLGALLRRHDNPSVRYSEPFKDGEQLLAECGPVTVGGVARRDVVGRPPVLCGMIAFELEPTLTLSWCAGYAD